MGGGLRESVPSERYFEEWEIEVIPPLRVKKKHHAAFFINGGWVPLGTRPQPHSVNAEYKFFV